MSGKSYWIVEGEAVSALDALGARCADNTAAMSELAESVGAKSEVFVDRGNGRLVGFEFESVPAGWVEHRRIKKCFVPSSRMKGGKTLLQKMKAIGPAFCSAELGRAMLGTAMARDGDRMFYAGLDVIGDLRIVVASSSKDWKPVPGLRLLRDSEYWALKEAAAAKKTEAEVRS
jgi:hypothetical protein